jgi:voltage-gated sodium channel
MIREKLRNYFDSDGFQKLIVTIIIINSVLIGLETSPSIMNSIGAYIDQIDLIILGIFIIEIILKVYAYRLGFFKSSWNLFDSGVVLISVLPAAGSFAVFRALRILRTLRLLKNIPKLKIIIESLLLAVPSIGWIMVLLMIIFYIFAVIGTNLFGVDYPEYFGTLGESFYTLFQIMTLESWSSAIARPITDGAPFSSIYFITFILIATYTTLNIFIAIVVNTMNELHHRDLVKEEENIKKFVGDENKAIISKIDLLSSELKDLKEQLNKKK